MGMLSGVARVGGTRGGSLRWHPPPVFFSSFVKMKKKLYKIKKNIFSLKINTFGIPYSPTIS